MTKYHVVMLESLAKTIEIEAESAEEAERLVSEHLPQCRVVKEKVVGRKVMGVEEMLDVGSLIERFGTKDGSS